MDIYQIICLVVAIISMISVSCVYIFITLKENKILNMRKKEFELRVCILESEVESLKDTYKK